MTIPTFEFNYVHVRAAGVEWQTCLRGACLAVCVQLSQLPAAGMITAVLYLERRGFSWHVCNRSSG